MLQRSALTHYCCCLHTGATIKNGLVRGFINQGFAEFEAYATKTVDGELLGKIRIVKTYGHLLLSHIPKIMSKCIKDISMAGMYNLHWSLHFSFCIHLSVSLNKQSVRTVTDARLF